MLCPTACRSPALSVMAAVCTTDLLYVLFSDNTSQDTFPVPVLYNDDVHCFVSAPPKLSITAIVKYLKGITGRKLFERFPEIRNQLWKGELWNHSYYVETIGSVSEENIRRYIEHQSKSY